MTWDNVSYSNIHTIGVALEEDWKSTEEIMAKIFFCKLEGKNINLQVLEAQCFLEKF